MRQTDRQTEVRQKHCLMSTPIRGGGIITLLLISVLICTAERKSYDLWDFVAFIRHGVVIHLKMVHTSPSVSFYSKTDMVAKRSSRGSVDNNAPPNYKNH